MLNPYYRSCFECITNSFQTVRSVSNLKQNSEYVLPSFPDASYFFFESVSLLLEGPQSSPPFFLCVKSNFEAEDGDEALVE
jgi:hypothetical protein